MTSTDAGSSTNVDGLKSTEPSGVPQAAGGTAGGDSASTDVQPLSFDRQMRLALAEQRIVVDRDAGLLAAPGRVSLPAEDWLELLACLPQTREHESLLVVDALPSQIHFNLLLLGLEPGAPLTVEQVGEPGDGVEADRFEFNVTPPHGPAVAVSLWFIRDGKPVEVPANEWVVNKETGKPLASNIWLFTGSRFALDDGRMSYAADRSGSVISLVNFGDDLLTRDTTMTKDNDGQLWGARRALLPPEGTPVAIVFRSIAESDTP